MQDNTVVGGCAGALISWAGANMTWVGASRSMKH